MKKSRLIYKVLIEKKIEIHNQIEEISRINDFLEKLGEEWGLSASLLLSLTLVMEEALTNIISYGYEDGKSHRIEVHFTKLHEALSICIIDDGLEYDPTLRPDPDINLSAEEREIGGLGIFLIKKIMDQVHYKRKNGRNYLTLNKKL